MADMTYRCHHCGSVHEVEAIRENLYLDQRTIASYAVGRLQSYSAIPRFLLARRIAAALWPRYPRGARQSGTNDLSLVMGGLSRAPPHGLYCIPAQRAR